MQRPRSLVLLALVGIALAAPAAAQWKWRDKEGRIQYSDRPPPQGTPEKSILEKPKSAPGNAALATAATTAASSAGVTVAPAARQVDPELEVRRKKVEQDEAAKKKQDDERQAAARAENCIRARGQLRTLEEGGRLSRTNAQGEREVLDDTGRAQEVSRAKAAITADCR